MTVEWEGVGVTKTAVRNGVDHQPGDAGQSVEPATNLRPVGSSVEVPRPLRQCGEQKCEGNARRLGYTDSCRVELGQSLGTGEHTGEPVRIAHCFPVLGYELGEAPLGDLRRGPSRRRATTSAPSTRCGTRLPDSLRSAVPGHGRG